MENQIQIDISELMPTGKAAKLLSTSRQNINNKIKNGDLPAYRFGRRYRVNKNDVLAMLKPVDITINA